MSLMPSTTIKSDGSLFFGWDEPSFPLAPTAPVITARAPVIPAPVKAGTGPGLAPRASHGLSDHERAVLVEFGCTYELGEGRGRPIIICRVCRRDSFNEDDRKNLYCGACNAFHGDRLAAWEREKAAQPKTNGVPADRAKEIL
jgi:hypothetical protein